MKKKDTTAIQKQSKVGKEPFRKKLLKPLEPKITNKNFLTVESFNLDKIRKKLDDRKFPDRTFLVKMKLNNGFWTTFIVSTKEPYFEYQKGKYIIDPDFLEFDVGSNLWGATYHQALSFPIKITIDIKQITEKVEKLKNIESQLTINPKVLDATIESDFVKKVIAGQKLAETLAVLKNWVMYNLIVTGLILVFLLFKFGGFVK